MAHTRRKIARYRWTSMKKLLARLRIDPFTLALLCTVALASLLPVSGTAAAVMDDVTDVAIAALFFLHGARLSREAVKAGALHWRLHLVILGCTFVLFPLLGLLFKPLAHLALTPELYVGVLFLCALPSTVQSSIAFTSMARGNVPAAVCAASLSSLLGVFFTPLLMGALVGSQGAMAHPAEAIGKILLQLLVPFLAGHFMRPWIGGWVERHRAVLRYTDQGTILLVVYTAFSASVNEGLWQKTPLPALLAVLAVAGLLLAMAMLSITFIARRLHFGRADEIAIVFCGSKKSLATGVPMAKVMFAGGGLGAIVLPIMLYHQLQLIVCAVVAARYARSASGQPQGATERH
ncbi:MULTISPECIES: bile acid:sodium symporter family protein [Xanthomonas]|uniref:Bile acid:sodium symporter n=1 Tax=Xanthomonas phaseoli pv. dieffenbachiae TaxID=92828 RepID=A0A1V9H877_9XANT|nr:bile acid:sodium symporter family protein [Xanthomonas phaseoli]MBO9768690.1 bile acid:sodium symporter [Xanthomonas phaseoli pv. dieffenbachiae]MBO9776889.1 bile acid:sodium symporter [Xanthomonas phaseoli pv. dieffenbachiae]MBO9781880.1 bile acid:sodium symporter [Xanthomonas phaseoli pv. dieffenbachiae]MBO9787329.1 bile acid:sodium symporter [Xanthomonas phaseoli pv. dieffenbachiae]MBO9797401.1 bile acid:sodium symporter [Xanthomonas phaseoli pv. dieffenbachiae]